MLFSTFQNITREKPALYLSPLEAAEPNDSHMTGIVGDGRILFPLFQYIMADKRNKTGKSVPDETIK